MSLKENDRIEEDRAEAIEDKYWAHGSGGNVALGALYMGATPQEAVKAATYHDTYTGRGIQVFTSEAAKQREKRNG